MGMSAKDIMDNRLPATGPAETSAGTPAGTPAPTGETQTFYGGKYTSLEEWEKGHREAEQTISRLGEENARLRALLLNPEPTAPPGYVPAQPAPEVGYPADASLGDFVTREEAIRLAEQAAERRQHQYLEQQRQVQWYSAQQERLRADFFTRYPDLQKHTRLVAAVTAELAPRYAGLDPQRFLALWPSIAKELSDAVYSELSALKAEHKAEFERMAAERAAGAPVGTAGVAVPPAGAPPPQTPDEARMEALKEEHERYLAARRPPSR